MNFRRLQRWCHDGQKCTVKKFFLAHFCALSNLDRYGNLDQVQLLKALVTMFATSMLLSF